LHIDYGYITNPALPAALVVIVKLNYLLTNPDLSAISVGYLILVNSGNSIAAIA